MAPEALPAEPVDAVGPDPELTRLWELAPSASDASEPAARGTWQASLPGELDLDEPQGSDDVEEPVALEPGRTDEPAAATAIPAETVAHTATRARAHRPRRRRTHGPCLVPPTCGQLPARRRGRARPACPGELRAARGRTRRRGRGRDARGDQFPAVARSSWTTRSSRGSQLGRVLESEGWSVEWVRARRRYWEALRESEWHALFVDVSLPDASGRPHLQALTGVSRSFEIIALTREPAEDRLARASGVRARPAQAVRPGLPRAVHPPSARPDGPAVIRGSRGRRSDQPPLARAGGGRGPERRRSDPARAAVGALPRQHGARRRRRTAPGAQRDARTGDRQLAAAAAQRARAVRHAAARTRARRRAGAAAGGETGFRVAHRSAGARRRRRARQADQCTRADRACVSGWSQRA